MESSPARCLPILTLLLLATVALAKSSGVMAAHGIFRANAHAVMAMSYFANMHEPSIYPTGPFLQFRGSHANNCCYTVMIVHPPSLGFEPIIKIAGAPATVSSPQLLDESCGYHFWRFDLTVPILDKEQFVRYTVGNLQERRFRVAGRSQPWRWAFFSCNGFSTDVALKRRRQHAYAKPLWIDILRENETHGLHLLIGGGDQLYFDQLWDIPSLDSWCRITDKTLRQNAPFTSQMREETQSFFMGLYMKGYHDDGFTDALSCIPHCMSWDDHDIFDGWGSYPDYLQKSNVFKGVFDAALRYYLLFQLHTSQTMARQEGYFGQSGYNKLLQCGDKLAIILPDTRTERTLDTILFQPSWEEIWSKLRLFPPTIDHVLFVAPVPMAYPHFSSYKMVRDIGAMANASKDAITSVAKAIGIKADITRTEIFQEAVNRFGEPELLDDLADQWTCEKHISEKIYVIQNLQQIAQERRMRITILSGDAHLGACGLLYTRAADSPAHSVINSHLMRFLRTTISQDHRFMYQFVSSGIGNLPPSPIVTFSLLRHTKELFIDENTAERMLDIFKRTISGPRKENRFFLRRRNWCLGEGSSDGSLQVSICAERIKGDLSGETIRYSVNIPSLER